MSTNMNLVCGPVPFRSNDPSSCGRQSAMWTLRGWERRVWRLTTVLAAATIFAVAGLNVAKADIVSFRQGEDSGFGVYTGAADTYISSGSPDSVYNSVDPARLWIDFPSEQALLVFNGIFGSGPGQIPLGSTIDSASLTLRTTDDQFSGGTSKNPTRIYFPWDASTLTWNNATLGSNTSPGIQVFGTNAEADFAGNGPGTFFSAASGQEFNLDVTLVVQQWSNGAGNYGFLFDMHTDDALGLVSSDGATVSQRPRLTVNFTPIPEPSTSLLLFTGIAVAATIRRQRIE